MTRLRATVAVVLAAVAFGFAAFALAGWVDVMQVGKVVVGGISFNAID